LTKPGIIAGNDLAALAGFFLASRGHPILLLLCAMLVGLSCVIGSACVFNNYLDRGLDIKMKRTSHRALVTGAVTPARALVFAVALGTLGLLVLQVFTNLLTAILALFGMFSYVVIYGIAKRRGPYGTLVGSISGAVPPVVGYAAVTGHLDIAAVVLFFILVLWQMPHFYAIAIYRGSDYESAGVPVLPGVRGIPTTRLRMLAYIVAFTLVAPLLTLYGYAGRWYAVAAVLLGAGWLVFGLTGYTTRTATQWARRMFLSSLAVLTLLCLCISLAGVIP
jgi:protoheme IX farnesyltransferase